MYLGWLKLDVQYPAPEPGSSEHSLLSLRLDHMILEVQHVFNSFPHHSSAPPSSAPIFPLQPPLMDALKLSRDAFSILRQVNCIGLDV